MREGREEGRKKVRGGEGREGGGGGGEGRGEGWEGRREGGRRGREGGREGREEGRRKVRGGGEGREGAVSITDGEAVDTTTAEAPSATLVLISTRRLTYCSSIPTDGNLE